MLLGSGDGRGGLEVLEGQFPPHRDDGCLNLDVDVSQVPEPFRHDYGSDEFLDRDSAFMSDFIKFLLRLCGERLHELFSRYLFVCSRVAGHGFLVLYLSSSANKSLTVPPTCSSLAALATFNTLKFSK